MVPDKPRHMSTTKGIPLTFPSWHDLNVSAEKEGADQENMDDNRASRGSHSSSSSGGSSTKSPPFSEESSISKVSLKEGTCDCVVFAKI